MTTTTTTPAEQVQGERPQRPWRQMTMQSTAFLNDQVEEIHRRLFDDPLYKSLISATTNAQAVEGSTRDGRHHGGNDDPRHGEVDWKRHRAATTRDHRQGSQGRRLPRYGASCLERGEIVEKE